MLEVTERMNISINIAWFVELNVNKKKIKFITDSGAMRNVLPLSIFKNLGFSDKVITKTN